jgi:hypothetical protein
MRIKLFIFFSFLFLSSIFFSHFSKAQDYFNIIGEDAGEKKKNTIRSAPSSSTVPYSEETTIIKETVIIPATIVSEVRPEEAPFEDPRVQIIGWDTRVPLKYLLASIQEGVTDQSALLKLFSAPNIITRSDQEKEVWIYHWLWSYNNTKDPETTYILMNDQGLKLKHNKRPVSLSIVFNDKNIVESYSLKLLKVKHDRFYEQ